MALGTASNDDSLEEYYALLNYLARCHLDPRLTRKFSIEDLVQETMLSAPRWDQFQGQGRQQRKAWLRIILLHTLATELAHIKDDVNLERADSRCRRRFIVSASGVLQRRTNNPRRTCRAQ